MTSPKTYLPLSASMLERDVAGDRVRSLAMAAQWVDAK